MWLPCMDKMLETKVNACLLCQVVTQVYIREPLQMSVLPDSPFDEVSVDFAHVDERFPFVEPVLSTSASAVIPSWIRYFPHLELLV